MASGNWTVSAGKSMPMPFEQLVTLANRTSLLPTQGSNYSFFLAFFLAFFLVGIALLPRVADEIIIVDDLCVTVFLRDVQYSVQHAS